MAIDPISGAVIAEPGIAPFSATGVSQFIDQIGASLNQITQTALTPSPPSGPTYAPALLGSSLIPLLLLGGGVYFLMRRRGSYARNPSHSFRTVRLPGGRRMVVRRSKGHWTSHSHHANPGRNNTLLWVLGAGALYVMMQPRPQVMTAWVSHPYVRSNRTAGHTLFD